MICLQPVRLRLHVYAIWWQILNSSIWKRLYTYWLCFGIDLCIWESSIQDADHNQAHRYNDSPSNTYLVHLPALLPGSRCYTLCQIKSPHLQKRLAWESSSSTQERILHKISTSRQQLQTVSVVMAEAPAMALAAAVTESLHLHNINFLSDNQELVNFFNNRDRSTPPDRRIKHLRQNFINSTIRETQVSSR